MDFTKLWGEINREGGSWNRLKTLIFLYYLCGGIGKRNGNKMANVWQIKLT